MGLGGDGIEGGGSESGPGEGLVGVSVRYEGMGAGAAHFSFAVFGVEESGGRLVGVIVRYEG